MPFEFATATRILFGEGKRSEAAAIARTFGNRCLLVTGRDATRGDRLALEKSGLETERVAIVGEPSISEIERAVGMARAQKCQCVIAIGGGSALDAGKAISALATNEGPTLDYLEIIGAGRPLAHDPLPFIAIPTTAGTGAEVTRNAVLSSPERKLKVSLRSPRMLPTVAIIDPELTYDLPPHLTATTGLDALTQLIEPFLSVRANPFTDALCREAIPRVVRALPVAFKTGMDRSARNDMALGSLFGGLALANAGLGAVHGLASPIGGMFPAPHGAVCAALLPHALRVNRRALTARAGDSLILRRFEELSALFEGDMISRVTNFCDAFEVGSLRRYGVGPEHFAAICERAAQSSSMQANPIRLTPEELEEIVARAT